MDRNRAPPNSTCDNVNLAINHADNCFSKSHFPDPRLFLDPNRDFLYMRR
jgi:hypothetical protein